MVDHADLTALLAGLQDPMTRLVLADALEEDGRIDEASWCRMTQWPLRVADGEVEIDRDSLVEQLRENPVAIPARRLLAEIEDYEGYPKLAAAHRELLGLGCYSDPGEVERSDIVANAADYY